MDFLGSIVHAVGVFFERERIPAKDPISVLFIIFFDSIDAFVTVVSPPLLFSMQYFVPPPFVLPFSSSKCINTAWMKLLTPPKNIYKLPLPLGRGGGDYPT